MLYVSAAASGSQHDGKSWRTAWQKLSDINWSQALPGTFIVIDGGTKGMAYDTGVTVQSDGTANAPISLVASNETGRNGQVVISGKKMAAANGIEIGNHKYINIGGQTWKAIRVAFFSGNGVQLGSKSQNVKLANLEIDNNGFGTNGGGAGLILAGNSNTASQLIVHDNALNVSAAPSPSSVATTLSYSWIYNDAAHTAYRTDGVNIVDAPPSISSNKGSLMVLDSIIGPGLSTGISVQGTRGATTYISDCLFLNAEKANVERNASSNNSLDVLRITSFMTRRNAHGQGHAALQFTVGAQDSLKNSVVMGGVIQVTGNKALGANNVQFGTEGNTNLISPGEEDPKFLMDLSKIPGTVPVSYLTSLDYSLSASSPQKPYGLGSKVTSVRQLTPPGN